jgi:hypothetical protein
MPSLDRADAEGGREAVGIEEASRSRSMRRLCWIGLASLVPICSSCTSAPSVIRPKASWDMRCPEKDITIVQIERVHIKRNVWTGQEKVSRSIYRADGCGTSATYVCEGWNSYEQAPVCELRNSN